MIEGHYRKVYQKVCIEPLLPFFHTFAPQTITLLGFLIGLMVGPLIFFHFPWTAFLALLLSGFFDTLDGSLARYLQLTSSKGAALDIVCDRVVEFSVIMGLFFADVNTRAFPCLLMLGSILLCVTTFLVVGIFVENPSTKSFFYSPGLMERAEAFLFFSLMILFPSIFLIAAYLFSVLTFFTAFLRLWEFMKNERDSLTKNN